MTMKLSSNLPSGFKEPSTQDTEHAGNRHTQEASPPPDVQPATTQRRHQHSSRSWLKKLEKSGLPAHAFHESLGPSNHRNNLPEAVSIHRPTSKPLTEIGTAEKQDAESIRQSSARDALSTCKQEYSNIKWEFTEGPLDITNQGLSLQKLKLNKANIAEGSFGSVSIFENKNGDKLIGKISKKLLPAEQRGSAKDELVKELWAYLTIYKAAGPHPNLVNAHGIAQVPHGTDMQRALLMDFIPGPTGEKTFYALRKCWDTGKISSEQYWGAIQFIGRRLLDVTGHLGKAGVVHNDIKPANFLVNEQTGELVLIDLGLWSKKDARDVGGTSIFNSPEVKFKLGVDERSDVFTVGTALLKGIERGKITPNKGLLQRTAFKDAEGNMVRKPGTYSAKTAYTEFMNSVLEISIIARVNSEKAKKLPFLSNSMLDDEAAKKVITDAISDARKEEKTELTNHGNVRKRVQEFERQRKLRRRKFDVDLTSHGNVRERVQEFERQRQLRRRKFDVDLTSHGNVRERVQEFERQRQLRRRK